MGAGVGAGVGTGASAGVGAGKNSGAGTNTGTGMDSGEGAGAGEDSGAGVDSDADAVAGLSPEYAFSIPARDNTVTSGKIIPTQYLFMFVHVFIGKNRTYDCSPC